MSSMFFFNKLLFTDSSQSVCSLAARFHILSESSGGWSNADITELAFLSCIKEHYRKASWPCKASKSAHGGVST